MIDQNLAYLKWKVEKGWSDKKIPTTEEYIKRKDYELSIVEKMNFCDYFLIIEDIVSWAKSRNIPCGPGRGCFTPNNVVRVNYYQFKKIKDVNIGDVVQCEDGEWRHVEILYEYNCKENVVCIKTKDEHVIDSTTMDHKIKIVTKENYKNKNFEQEWAQAKDVRNGDFIVSHNGIEGGKFLLKEVIETKVTEYDGKVYDLGVQDVHSYSIDDLVVHNSAAGSILCYALNITTLDPIRFGLLFERFLNPSRISLPDIDLDMGRERRIEVIDHVRRKYGDERVAHIITFLAMKNRGAIKDVARVQELENYVRVADRIAKAISPKVKTIEEAIKSTPFLQTELEKYPELFRMAECISGKARSAGIHPAGIILSPKPLTEYMPLHYGSKSKERHLSVVQWDMYDVEDAGFLKVDFLGLNTLTIVNKTIRRINIERENQGLLPIDIEDIDLEDKDTLKLFSNGLTTGIFQLERKYVQDFCRNMGIKNFMDVCVMNAIIRPGTMDAGTTDEFIARRRGDSPVEYMHDSLKEVLEETYGILCIEQNSLITMADGSEKQIKNISKGDMITSINDDMFSEIDICDGCAKTVKEDGVVLKLDNGHELFLTKDHKVMTPSGYKNADFMNVGDLVMWNIQSLDTNNEPFPAPFGSGCNISYLLGLFTGSGELSNRGISILCGYKERDIEGLKLWIDSNIKGLTTWKHFDTGCFYINIEFDRPINSACNDKDEERWISYLKKLDMMQKSYEKTIPVSVMTASKDIKLAFVAGLIDSTGDIYSFGTHIVSISKRMLISVCRILRSFGVKYYIKKNAVHYYDSCFDKKIEKYLIIKKIPDDRSVCGKNLGWCDTDRVKRCVYDSGISIEKFCLENGLKNQTHIIKDDVCNHSTAEKFGVNLGDCSFSKITAKEYRNGIFYGMSVRKNHNLVCNGAVISNCYQEQAMKVAQVFAGFSLAEADNLRKCVTGDSLFICDNGIFSIKEIFQEIKIGKVFNVLTVGQNGEHRYARIVDVWSNGDKQVYKLKTTSGYSIKTTNNHQFFTRREWQKLEDLNKNDKVVIIKEFNQKEFSKNKTTNTDAEFTNIKSIELCGKEEVFDFTVDNCTHCAFVNGILVHNSIGKKIPEKMEKAKELFIEKAVSQMGRTKEEAFDIFSYIETFANYGFNKSIDKDTLIHTKNRGDIKIVDTKPGDIVRCLDEETGELVDTDVITLHDHGEIIGFEITFDDGSKEVCSRNHKFMTKLGQVQLYIILSLGLDILSYNKTKEDSSCLTGFFNKRNVKIVAKSLSAKRIISCKNIGIRHMYDLEVRHKSHNFCLSSGLITSNSHAVSYGKVTFQSAYLKAHYTTMFMCELLNGELGVCNTDSKIGEYIEEARYFGIKIIPPSVLTSMPFFEVRGDYAIEFGLAFVKNVSVSASNEIVKARGMFNNLSEFLVRTNFSIVRSKAIESLIQAGAMDCFGNNRDEILEKHKKIRKLVSKMKLQQKKKAAGTKLRKELSLADIIWEENEPVEIRDVRDKETMLDIEFQETGCYLSESPMAPFQREIREYTNSDIADIADHLHKTLSKNDNLCIAGMVKDVKEHIIKRGKNEGSEMCFITISNNQRSIECVLFSKAYESFKYMLKEGKVYLFYGKMDRSFVVEDIKLLSTI